MLKQLLKWITAGLGTPWRCDKRSALARPEVDSGRSTAGRTEENTGSTDENTGKAGDPGAGFRRTSSLAKVHS